MKLHLNSAYEVHPGLDTVLSSAMADSKRAHSLCDCANDADAIVFIENTQFDDVLFKRLRSHELVQTYPNKIFMYNEMDRPWDVLPGLYTCMSNKHFDANRQRAFTYLSTPNKHIRDIHHENPERRWLFSFMGAMSHTCRHQIMRLPTTHAYLKDTSEFNVWNTTAQEMDIRAQDYAQVLGSSHFVLCPRGIGTSSLRLYETLEAGRTPVIISDQWVAPPETDWKFAVRVKEKNLNTLPTLLQSIESEAIQRGQAARDAWLSSYSHNALFNTLGNAIADIQQQDHHTEHSRSAASRRKRLEWNKWLASGSLYARTALQRVRSQR